MSLGLISLMDLILFTSYLQRFHWKKKSMANFSSGSVLSLEFLQKIMKKISTSKYLHWKNQIYTKVKFPKYLQKIIEIVPIEHCPIEFVQRSIWRIFDMYNNLELLNSYFCSPIIKITLRSSAHTCLSSSEPSPPTLPSSQGFSPPSGSCSRWRRSARQRRGSCWACRACRSSWAGGRGGRQGRACQQPPWLPSLESQSAWNCFNEEQGNKKKYREREIDR